jgi:hypothetical protein
VIFINFKFVFLHNHQITDTSKILSNFGHISSSEFVQLVDFIVLKGREIDEILKNVQTMGFSFFWMEFMNDLAKFTIKADGINNSGL